MATPHYHRITTRGNYLDIGARNDKPGGVILAINYRHPFSDHAVIALDLHDAITARDELTRIIDQQTGADTVPGCDGSYTCPAHIHADTCLLTPGN